MEMDLSGFQLIDDAVTDMDMLRMSNQNIQTNIDLLFQSNNTFYSSKSDMTPSSMSQNDSYDQHEDIFTPLMSPAMTPSFNYQPMNSNHTPNLSHSLNQQTEFEFSQLSSPAMLPQKSAQISEQYEQLEQAKLIIQQKFSEYPQNYNGGNFYKNQGKTANRQHYIGSSNSNPNSPTQSPHLKPATPASLMNMKPPHPSKLQFSSNKKPKTLLQSPVVSSHYVSPRLPPSLSVPPSPHTLKPRKAKAKKKRREPNDKAGVSPRTLKPLLISPTLQPGASDDAERILATRSNYQNLMEGKAAALGIAFTTQIKSGIEIRRTAHKAAEQKRRDSLKECFERLRLEVEEGYVKQQKSLLSKVMEAQALEEEEDNDEDEDKKPAMKPLSKVLLLQYAYEYIISLKSTLDEKDTEIENILSNKRKRTDEEDDIGMI